MYFFQILEIIFYVFWHLRKPKFIGGQKSIKGKSAWNKQAVRTVSSCRDLQSNQFYCNGLSYTDIHTYMHIHMYIHIYMPRFNGISSEHSLKKQWYYSNCAHKTLQDSSRGITMLSERLLAYCDRVPWLTDNTT